MVVDDDSVRYTGTINSNNVAERAGAWQNVACNAFLNFICVPKGSEYSQKIFYF